MTEPVRATDLDETVLDEGRTRRFTSHHRLVETVLDEGRRRTGAAGTEWTDDGTLPADLAERYALVERLDVTASQADLFHVRVHDTGADAVIKRYRASRTVHPQLETYLSERHPHVVGFLEFGPGYEVMDFLPDGTLLDRRETGLGGVELADLREVTQQLAAALVDLHRHGLIHRDVKPANVMVRASTPLELTLVDFGVAGPVRITSAEELNPAYQPPESVLVNDSTEAGDWWGLGMTLLELAAGEHPFEGLEPEAIRGHFGRQRAVDVAPVPDPRLRALCQGLLLADPAERWGSREVGDWLVGRDPTPRSAPATRDDRAAGGEPDRADRPFVFDRVPYHYRDDLAQGLSVAWNRAVEVLFDGAGALDVLLGWLEQFTDDEAAEARRLIDSVGRDPDVPGDVRLVRVLRALHPTRRPLYRHYIMARRPLVILAHRALSNEGDAMGVLQDLWNYRLLPTFDAAVLADEGAGGEGLTDLHREWRAEWQRWEGRVRQVGDAQARTELSSETGRRLALAACLRAAVRDPADGAAVREFVRQVDARLPVPVPWFHALVERPELTWVALLLSGHAVTRARTEADRWDAITRRDEDLRMTRAFREWSRRQNRPVAVGWAVVGGCLFAVAWVALISASDRIGWADDRSVGLAWVGAAVCLAVTLMAECLLAAEIGGLFHHRYSIPGAGALALRRLGRWMQRRRYQALATIVLVGSGVGWAAARFPEWVAIVTTAGHLAWVASRWRAWEAHVTEEDARVAAAEQRRPSGTETDPIGLTSGANT